MKKTLLILALAMISFANAQKGTYLVSGDVGFNSHKINSERDHADQIGFSITPKIGYQFTETWTVGAKTGVSFSENETDEGKGKSNSYSIGAFVRYSKPLSEIFELYADFGVSYASSSGSYTDAINNTTMDSSKSNGVEVGITPALLLKIKNGFALNFSIGGIDYSSMNYDNGTSNENTSITFGQSAAFGISKNF